MSDAKKPGARDISDLKARLGLKKGGGAAEAPAPAPGGIPSPPRMGGGGGFVPPPPGVTPPQPARPAIPDARVDPFGAMNAMASHQAVQAQPQIVVVREGEVEKVNKGRGAVLAKWLAIAAIPLVLGFVIGGISYKNQEYNATIADATGLVSEIRTIGKPLQSLTDTLLVAKERGPGRQAFLVGDKQLTADLEGLGLKAADPAPLLHSHLYNMDTKLVEDTLLFYSDLRQLYALVETHVKLSKGDEKRIAKDSDVAKALRSGARFGVIINVPKKEGDIPQAQIVEVGLPICAGQTTPAPAGCGTADPAGFQYRPDMTSTAWGSKPWAKAFAPEQVVMLDPSAAVTRAVLQGAESFYDEVSYMKRIQDIESQTQALMERRKSIEDRLNRKATESKRFSL